MNRKFVAVVVFVLACFVSGATAYTQDEFETWLVEIDDTNEHEYVNESYACVGFSDDLRKNASAAGFNVSFVGLYDDAEPHAVICLWIWGENIELYEPQTDKCVTDYYAYDNINTTYRIFGDYVIVDWEHIKVGDGDVIWQGVI